MNVLEKVRAIVGEVRGGQSPAKIAENWALAGRLLGRLTNDLARVEKITTVRDVDELDRLVRELEHRVAAAEAAPLPTFPPEELERALRAFLKRLKVSRLADESKLGGRYTSGGRKSKIDGMQPPEEFPKEIWTALVRAGKLRDLGHGFYREA